MHILSVQMNYCNASLAMKESKSFNIEPALLAYL